MSAGRAEGTDLCGKWLEQQAPSTMRALGGREARDPGWPSRLRRGCSMLLPLLCTTAGCSPSRALGGCRHAPDDTSQPAAFPRGLKLSLPGPADRAMLGLGRDARRTRRRLARMRGSGAAEGAWPAEGKDVGGSVLRWGRVRAPSSCCQVPCPHCLTTAQRLPPPSPRLPPGARRAAHDLCASLRVRGQALWPLPPVTAARRQRGLSGMVPMKCERRLGSTKGFGDSWAFSRASLRLRGPVSTGWQHRAAPCRQPQLTEPCFRSCEVLVKSYRIGKHPLMQ